MNRTVLKQEKTLDSIMPELYEKMLEIRLFEERIIKLARTGAIKGTAHCCIGQEAVSVGVCSALEKEDYIFSNHRGHGHLIAKGAMLMPMMAELLGKEGGYCGGKGGSMHIIDPENNSLGCTGIVGSGVPIAAGAALTCRLNNNGRIVVAFFGDGALNQGVVSETFNYAKIWSLPILFICENNQYAVSVNVRDMSSIDILSERMKGFNIESMTIDGNDVVEVYQETIKAVDRVRTEGVPFFIECMTYRLFGHSVMRQDSSYYRSAEEEESWLKKEPLKRLRDMIIRKKVLTEKEIQKIERLTEQKLEVAAQAAIDSPSPAIDQLYKNVYK